MWLMDWSWRRYFFLVEQMDSSLARSLEMVLIVSHNGG